MTFLEALYGSQYHEIAQQGKDGNKGRLNGNLFLSAFIIVAMLIIVAFFLLVSAHFRNNANESIESVSGGMGGKSVGKILAIPLLGIIYFVISRTVGSEEKFKFYVDRFMQYPDEIKEKAASKLLIPFCVAVVLLFALGIISLHTS